MTGKVTYHEFHEQAESLYKKSQELDDKWSLRVYHASPGQPVRHFLVKQCLLTVPTNRNIYFDDVIEKTFEDDAELQEDMDNSDNVVTTPNNIAVLKMDYNVIYSDSYAVPVLYFNAQHMDGRILLHDELDVLFSSSHADAMKSQIMTTLTQVEHPILQQPFYMLHPCKTSVLMSAAAPEADLENQGSFLLQWISSIGSAVGLTMDVEYLVS